MKKSKIIIYIFFFFFFYICNIKFQYRFTMELKLKKFAVSYILDWFQQNRPELNAHRDWAENFYNEIKDQLAVIEKDGDRNTVSLFLDIYLGNYYINPVNQICKEVIEEEEFRHKTAELKSIGFLYTEELEGLITYVSKYAEWAKDFNIDESLLENEEFRENIRKRIRTYWNKL